MKKYLILISYVAVSSSFSLNSFAETTSSQDKTTQEAPPQELNVDAGSFKKIFDDNVSAAEVESQSRTSFIDVEPKASYGALGNVRLKNQYFTVPFSDQVSGLPFFQVSSAYRWYSVGNFRFDPRASVGYGFRQSTLSVLPAKGSSLTDVVSLHWIPLEAGMRFSYRVHGLSFLSLIADPGIGVNWIYQSGRLDGINQGFWIPFGRLAAGINLFDQSLKSGGWFGGVSVVAARAFSFGSSQTADMWNFDLGVRFLL